MEAIQANQAPDYVFMGFNPDDWLVTDLFLVPRHFMTPTVVEERKPLSSDARRSGWIGSNIHLDRIPDSGRIVIVDDGKAIPREEARNPFQHTAFLSERDTATRDWTTAVMDCIEDLPVDPGDQFELTEVYEFENRLAELYPNNQHIRAKIRQQLQVLRDEGVIEFLGDGQYRLRWIDDREQ